MSASKVNPPRLAVESLEARELPAAAVTATLVGTVLTVEGTNSADAIRVRQAGDQVTVAGRPILVNGVRKSGVAASAVSRVEVRGLGGNDRIDLGNGPGGTNPVRADARVEGGAGNDTLVGGLGRDTLLGGAGGNTLADDGRTLARQTLLVVIPGFQIYRQAGDPDFDWRKYADKLAAKLEAAGTPTTTLLVDWNSWGSNAEPAARVAAEVRAFLGRQAETFDVFLFGHSRGAIFADVVAGQLGGAPNLGNVREVLLDPTAAARMQDRYPEAVPAGVKGSVYDDGYVVLPVGVSDGHRIAGADYHYVHDEMQKDPPPAARITSLASTAAAVAVKSADLLAGADWSNLSLWVAAARGAVDAVAYHTAIEDFYLNGPYVDADVAAFVADKSGRAQNRTPADLRQVTVPAWFDQNHADRLIAALNVGRYAGDLAITMGENYVDDILGMVRTALVAWQRGLGNDTTWLVARLDEVQAAFDGFVQFTRAAHNLIPYRQVELFIHRTLDRAAAETIRVLQANYVATPGEVMTALARGMSDIPKATAPGLANWLTGRMGVSPHGAITALVGGGKLPNGSFEVAKFLLNDIKYGLGTTAKTVSDWLGGNKPAAAFWAIAKGADRGAADGVRGLVGAGLLPNGSFEVAKFLLNDIKYGLGTTAKTVSDWLGGNKPAAAFWAIASPKAANRSYADAIRGLNRAGLLGTSYRAVSDFLFSQLSRSTALRVLNELF